jgi:hypothetical protein
MRLRPEELERYAVECRRRAVELADPHLRNTFEYLAQGWKDLADLQRRIEADRRPKRLP